MNYLNSYLIFENVQQFDKLLNSYMNTNTNYDNYGLYKLKDKLQSEGLIAYLGPITKIILSGDDTDFFVEDVDDIVDGIKFLKKNNIDIAKLDVFNISDFNDKIYDLGQQISIKQYINRWAPASIRKDAVKKWEKLFDYREEIENDTISDDLLKKGSRFNNANEWINYIINLFNGDGYDLEELKKSNIEIFYENDEILIYKALDFKSYMIVGYKYWCTMREITFYHYLKNDLIICLNKKDITDSLVSYIDHKKRIDVFNYGNNYITNNIPDKYKFAVDKMKSYHKIEKGNDEKQGGFFMLPYNEGFFETKLKGNGGEKMSELVAKNKANFQNLIGFLMNNIFDVYDIYEKKDPPTYKTGSTYWYGPMYNLGNKISIKMYIEQIDKNNDNIIDDLYDVQSTLEEISGLKTYIHQESYVDYDREEKARIVIEINLLYKHK